MTTTNSDEGRLKIAHLPECFLIDILNWWSSPSEHRTFTAPVIDQLPADAKVVGVHYEHDIRGVIAATIWSSEFPVVKPGDRIPRILDATRVEFRILEIPQHTPTKPPSVYLLTTGDGSEGDEWKCKAIYSTREDAEKARQEYERPRTRLDGTTCHYEAAVEEWPVD